MEDHRTDHRTDRLGVLLEQLDRAREIAQATPGRAGRAGEPPRRGTAGPGLARGRSPRSTCGSRRRAIGRCGAAGGPGAHGRSGRASGCWTARPATPTQPGDHDRLAAGHLHLAFAGSWEWTFGGRRQPPAQLVDFSLSAAVALERFWARCRRRQRFRPDRAPTARCVAWCSASTWSAPDGSGLLRWMGRRSGRIEKGPVGSSG